MTFIVIIKCETYRTGLSNAGDCGRYPPSQHPQSSNQTGRNFSTRTVSEELHSPLSTKGHKDLVWWVWCGLLRALASTKLKTFGMNRNIDFVPGSLSNISTWPHKGSFDWKGTNSYRNTPSQRLMVVVKCIVIDHSSISDHPSPTDGKFKMQVPAISVQNNQGPTNTLVT